MIEKMFSRTDLYEKALDASLIRNEAISDNIANIDTPNYKRKTVTFEDALANADETLKGKMTNSRHIAIGPVDIKDAPITITEDPKTLSMRLDGNNVDIDSEMAQLAKNSLKYNFLIQKVNGEFKKINSVISGGR